MGFVMAIMAEMAGMAAPGMSVRCMKKILQKNFCRRRRSLARTRTRITTTEINSSNLLHLHLHLHRHLRARARFLICAK